MRLAWRWRAALLVCSLSLGHGCGARSGLRPGDVELAGGEGGAGGENGASSGGEGGAPEPECQTSLDCPSEDRCARPACVEGECILLAPLDCGDDDPCTKDSCDPETGSCVHQAPSDQDGDGFDAITTDAAGCGDDCDDDAPMTYPGAPELCDGEDNDCDGAIDDGTTITYTGFEPVRVSALDLDSGSRGGVSRSEGTLGVNYTGKSSSRRRSYFAELDASGNPIGETRLLNEINADSYAGALLWSAEHHATAWTDARQDGNYEIYFNRLTARGEKLGPDLRLSDAPDFSVHPTLALLDDDSVVVAWDDWRFEDEGGTPAMIFGVTVGADGSATAELPLTGETERAEYPALAVGESRIGLAYTVLEAGLVHGRFKTFDRDRDLGAPSASVDLGALDAQDPVVAAAGGRFVVTWQTFNMRPGPVIMAALVSEDGVVERAGFPITSGAAHARSHTLLSLGDRLLLIWADDFDGNYELYSLIMDPDLNVLRARERITYDPADTVSPGAVMLSDGGVGILFDDWRSGTRQVYYTRCDCMAPL